MYSQIITVNILKYKNEINSTIKKQSDKSEKKNYIQS